MNVNADGSTALWKALGACEEHLMSYAARYPNARKRIIALSDGQDTTSLSLFSSLRASSPISSSTSIAPASQRRRGFLDYSSSDDLEDDLLNPVNLVSRSPTRNYSQYSSWPTNRPLTSNTSVSSSFLPPLQSDYDLLTSEGSLTQNFTTSMGTRSRDTLLSGVLASSTQPYRSRPGSSFYRPLASRTASSSNNSLNPYASLPSTATPAMHTSGSTHNFILPALSGSQITAQEICLRLQRNNIIVDSFFIGNGTNESLKRISFA